jgi:hypothetical protein
VAAEVGVRAHCIAKSGFAREAEYIALSPPRVAAVKMTRGLGFFESFAGSWRLQEEAPGQTRVFFRYHVQAWPCCSRYGSRPFWRGYSQETPRDD